MKRVVTLKPGPRLGGRARQMRQGVCALFITAFTGVPASALEVATENNPPFNFQDNQNVAGISTDIVIEMAKRAGVLLNIRVLPWARAYQTALNISDTCVYSTVRLPEREAQFKWVGPLTVNRWVLFARRDFDKRITNIDEAKPYRVGGVTVDAKSMYLRSLGFANIDLVGDDTLNFNKLLAGRIDLWITGFYKGRELSGPGSENMIKPVLFVRDVEYFLACNRGIPDATINGLSRALTAMQKEGVVQANVDRYAGRLQ